MNAQPESAVHPDRLLWMAAIVVGASLPHWPQLPAWIPVLLCASVGWRLAAGLTRWPMPQRPLRLLLAFCAFCGVLLQYRTLNGIEAGSALLVVMVALKFLESQNHRDQLVLMIIVYFLMFASLLTERSLFTAAYLVAVVWFTTAGLLQLGRRGPLLPNAATAKLAGRLLLHAAPVMVILFVLFPRLPGPLWAIPGSSSSASTGLSDEMSPGDITELSLSDGVAFRVEFKTRPPGANQLYWRGPVMSGFNGRTWSRAERVGMRSTAAIEYFGEPVEYRVMLEPTGRDWAFALDMPRSWSEDRALQMRNDYQLRVFGRQRGSRLDYDVTSHPDYRARESLTANQQALLTWLPPDNSPRTRALVATWLADDPTPQQIIDRSLDFLRSQPFYYTLEPPALGAQPVDEFLFETREGFCEHYASAFAVMMRAAGLPARIVTGYQGGELNNLGAYYIVWQASAHAWTEVWIEERGWVRVDPIVAVAPWRVSYGSRDFRSGGAITGPAGGRMEWLRSAVFAWDAANNYWNKWIIGYGPALQGALLEALGLEDPRRAERWTMLLALAVATTVALLVALSAYLAWIYRRRRTADPAARCFERFCRRLQPFDVAPRAPHEGPASYGLRAQRALPAAAAEIEHVVRAYLRARYEPDADGSALPNLRRAVADFQPAALCSRVS